jgi:hypothetical protein
MIGFLLRKTLYDLWDNMLKIVLVNMGFIALTAVPVLLPRLASEFFESLIPQMALSAFGILLCSVYLAAAAYSLKSISDYSSFGFSDFFHGLKIAWPAGLVMGLFVFVFFLIITVVIPFYMSTESLAGLFLAMFIFWSTIFAALSLQFYFTVYARLGSNLKKAFRKCMIISLDNSGLTLFMFLHNIVVLIISIFPVFLFPGPAGALLYLDEALRLRLLKYDWLEANPGANRRKIPWDEILVEEREKIGYRTIKNFIFPWKD